MLHRTALAAAALLVCLLAVGGCGNGESGEPCQPSAERCDGLDNDCNGVVDDGFEVGASCTAGVGACSASGERACAADGAASFCRADGPEASAEVCNGADDDCDGLTDEELSGCCVPGATRACGLAQGECREGNQRCGPERAWGAECLDGQGAVVQLPGGQAERCNGRDDDCDGAQDEDFAQLGQACDGSDADSCANGLYTCKADGSGVECVAETGASAVELCNGLDDDCDGEVDEDFAQLGEACDGADADLCANGQVICKADSSGVECAELGASAVESCNGQDDDCDGATDEDFPQLGQACDGTDWDLCANGVYTCGPTGAGVVCATETRLDIVERCNGLDDDCDGATDEDFPRLGQACDGSDSDLCATGQYVCKPDLADVVCEEAGSGAVEECNGVDDDCNGEVDEEYSLGCELYYRDVDGDGYGISGQARCLCAAGAIPGYSASYPGDCNDADDSVFPLAQEECNGRDDDCDTMVDESSPYLCLKPANCSVAACQAARCVIVTCGAGWFDVDGNYSNGCESSTP